MLSELVISDNFLIKVVKSGNELTFVLRVLIPNSSNFVNVLSWKPSEPITNLGLSEIIFSIFGFAENRPILN